MENGLEEALGWIVKIILHESSCDSKGRFD
jgi:hypothetical protein